jgi:ABC-2 type transport system permease protein
MPAFLLDKLWVIVRCDLLTALRYRMGFWIQTMGMVLELGASFFLAQAIGPQFRPDGVEYYPFLLVGTALLGFLITGVHALVNTIHDLQVNGTMEVLMTTSTSPPLLVFLTTFSSFAARTLSALFYLGVGLVLFPVTLRNPNLLACVLIFLLLLLISSAIGVMAAAVQVLTQKGRGLVALLAALAGFLGGTMFPVSVLPAPLRELAYLFPLTHAVQAMRLALLQGASTADLSTPLGVLTLYALLLVPAGLYMFSRAIRHARQKGTLSFY